MTAVKIIAGTALGFAAGYFVATRTRERAETERVAELDELLRQARQLAGGESWTRCIKRLLEDGHEVLKTVVKVDNSGEIVLVGVDDLSEDEKRELGFVLDKSQQQLSKYFRTRPLPETEQDIYYSYAVMEWVNDPDTLEHLTDEERAALWKFISVLDKQLQVDRRMDFLVERIGEGK